MSILAFAAPSKVVVDMACDARDGYRVRAARAWMKEARAVLLDGREVVPSMPLAYDVAKAIYNGMPSIAVAVEEGSYVLASQFDAREVANRERSERFQDYMAEDCPPEQGTGECDTCGVVGPVNNHYSADAMGYPTLVLQTCTEGCAG